MFPQQTNSLDDLNNSKLSYEHSSRDHQYDQDQADRWHRLGGYQSKEGPFWWLSCKVHGQQEFDSFDDGFWL